MTYKIYRGTKRFNNILFTTYEAARQYFRKWVRKNHPELAGTNASLAMFGFSIQKV